MGERCKMIDSNDLLYFAAWIHAFVNNLKNKNDLPYCIINIIQGKNIQNNFFLMYEEYLYKKDDCSNLSIFIFFI